MGSNPIGGFAKSLRALRNDPRIGNKGKRDMAKKGNRNLVKLRSTESGHMYYTSKNRRNTTQRLELKKYDPILRKHVLYKETK